MNETPTIAPPDLEALKRRLQALQGVPAVGAVAPLGLPALDAALPGGGLGLGGLHRLGGAAEADLPAALGFLVALLGRIVAARPDRPLLWVTRGAGPYPPGLAAFGLDPGAFLVARAGSEVDLLWALEEGLRSGLLAAVAGEAAALDRIAGRRLQLAAERGATPCLVLEWRPNGEPVPALTRWRIAAAPSGPAERPELPGRTRWRVELLQCRGGLPRQALVEWDDATGAFALAAGLRDGALAARAAG